MSPLIGVLALQGSFREHREAFERLGVPTIDVRTKSDLAKVIALILPGGESTTISKLLDSSGLREAIEKRLALGDLAIFGTCAGMILSARHMLDGTPDQCSFRCFSATVRRNAIGRQVASFETAVQVNGMEASFRAVFIRPPIVESVSDGVEVLAVYDQRSILCRQGRHLFATFHPELAHDDRIHRLFMEGL